MGSRGGRSTGQRGGRRWRRSTRCPASPRAGARRCRPGARPMCRSSSSRIPCTAPASARRRAIHQVPGSSHKLFHLLPALHSLKGETGSSYCITGGSCGRLSNRGFSIQVFKKCSGSGAVVDRWYSHELDHRRGSCKSGAGPVQVQLHGHQPEIPGLVGLKTPLIRPR